MKITAIRTRIVDLEFRDALFVWIDTDAGVTGVAETVMRRHTATIQQGVRLLSHYLIGKDPTEIEDHWEKMYRDSLHAKSFGVPVYKLFGGPTRRQVPCTVTVPPAARRRNLQPT